MWFRRLSNKRQRGTGRRQTATDVHYKTHKKLARSIILERLSYWSLEHGFEYRSVSIRNQRRRWGSCSSSGNLSFNYKIVFLPEALMDYVIVHELCHLKELNHSPVFWSQVASVLPSYKQHRRHLRTMTRVPAHGFSGSRYAQLRSARPILTEI